VNVNNGYHENNGSQQADNNGTQSTTPLTAIALYDYQANDSDELSFDPNDTITDIVQVIKKKSKASFF